VNVGAAFAIFFAFLVWSVEQPKDKISIDKIENPFMIAFNRADKFIIFRDLFQ
jgi:hypothetical protein